LGNFLAQDVHVTPGYGPWIEADLQPLNHELNSAWRLTQDREWWRQLVDKATLSSDDDAMIVVVIMND